MTSIAEHRVGALATVFMGHDAGRPGSRIDYFCRALSGQWYSAAGAVACGFSIR